MLLYSIEFSEMGIFAKKEKFLWLFFFVKQINKCMYTFHLVFIFKYRCSNLILYITLFGNYKKFRIAKLPWVLKSCEKVTKLLYEHSLYLRTIFSFSIH